VEEESKRRAQKAHVAELRHEPRVAALVHDDDVHAVEGSIEIEGREIERSRRDERVRPPHRGERPGSLLGQQISHAPSVRRFEGADFVAAGRELGRDAAEKVRAAVVPIRQERMTEDCQAHVVDSERHELPVHSRA
jgi:hypothetical protein